MASIDWNEFVVVQTITFDDENQDDLPEPIDLNNRDYIPRVTLDRKKINPEFSFLVDNAEKQASMNTRGSLGEALSSLSDNKKGGLPISYRYMREEMPPEFPETLGKRNPIELPDIMTDPNVLSWPDLGRG